MNTFVRDKLEECGYEDVPTHQHIGNEMGKLAAGDHLENLGRGVYRFVNDPRNN